MVTGWVIPVSWVQSITPIFIMLLGVALIAPCSG